MVAKLGDIVPTVDIILGNLEDGVPATDKEAARAGLVKVAKTVPMGTTQLWTRVNSLDSPWGLDDITTLVTEVGDKFDPQFHQAMFEAPVPGTKAGEIIQVAAEGFMLHDRLLRPAQVGVSSTPAS